MQPSSTIVFKNRAANRDKNSWQETVKEFETSNEGVKDFCERRNIKLGTLSHWRGVFKKEKNIQSSKFLEIKVRQTDKAQNNFTIECPSGHKIIFSDIKLEEAERMLKLLGLIAC